MEILIIGGFQQQQYQHLQLIRIDLLDKLPKHGFKRRQKKTNTKLGVNIYNKNNRKTMEKKRNKMKHMEQIKIY